MRTKYIANYNSQGAFELRNESGAIAKIIEPNEVFSIGNSIGGYWAKPIRYSDTPMLALIRLSGQEKHWPLERLQKRFGKEKGRLLWPGEGLWATTSGSARRGVWHRIREEHDPIRVALRQLGLPSNLLHEVQEINEETWVGGQYDRGGASRGWVITDGEQKNIPLDYETSFGSRKILVTGGTYLIKGTDFDKEDCRFARPVVNGVFVTPSADRQMVAELVKCGNHGVEKIEAKYGLRCPECLGQNCSVAVHDAERAAKAAAEKDDHEEREAKPIIVIDGVRYRLLAHNKQDIAGPKMALEDFEGRSYLVSVDGINRPNRKPWTLLNDWRKDNIYHVQDTDSDTLWHYSHVLGCWHHQQLNCY